MSLDPRLFGEAPARDARFEVRERWAEMTNLPNGHPEQTVEFLHRQMNEEVNGLEICARNLADFPDAPWELRMEMARQCWDEARHVVLFRRLLERRGARVGQYPVLNFQYRIMVKIDSLVGRLAVQNRSFEGAGIDAIQQEILSRLQEGDEDLARFFELQLADEIQHVRYANTWVKRLVEQGGPRPILELARAVAQAGDAFKFVAGDAAISYPVADELRREAGFDEDEIRAARAIAASL